MPPKKGCRLSWLEEKISDGFAAYGRFASRHPLPLIIVPIIVCGGLCVGLMRLRSINDTEEVFTPMNSQAKQDKARIRAAFPDYTADAFQLQNVVTLGRFVEVLGKMTTTDDNILQTASLDEIVKLNSHLENLTITDDGQTLKYADLCGKAFGQCVVTGAYLLSSDFRARVQAGNVTYPTIPSIPVPIETQQFLGELNVTGQIVTEAGYFRLRYNMRQDEGMDSRVKALEDKFIAELEKYKSSALEITYSMSRSLDVELAASISGDILFFSLTFTLMITYVSMISITTNMVASHANLARLGVVSTGLGLVAGLGLVCATGLDFVQIVGVTPFLLIGVGIDDIFVLLSGLADSYEKTQEEKDPDKAVEKRIAETLRTSGVAITITTVTNVLALAIGASSVFLSVRNFSVFTGACFLLAYFNHLTFFTGLMVLHERRVEGSRHEMLCCKEIGSKEQAKGKSCPFICCCTGSKPKDRDEAENLMEKVPHMITTKIVSFLPVRIFIIVASAAVLAVAIWGVTLFRSGLELSDLAVDGSYYKTYNKWVTDHFTRFEIIAIVTDNPVDYHTNAAQSQIEQLISRLKGDTIARVDDGFEINWLKDYKASQVYDNSSKTNFMKNLTTLFLLHYPQYKNDIVFNSDNTSITASRVYVRAKDLKTSESQADSMVKVQNIAATSSFPVFCFSPGYVFYEQYVAVVPNTLQTVGVAVGAVFLITCLFMPSLTMIIFLVFALAISLVEIFGFMHFWGLTLSSVTMIHIIMCVGFSVDFESHICHAYLVAEGNTRQEKVMHALRKVSGPVTHGAVSSLLGLLMLIFSKSFIFRSFFQVMVLVIVLGMGQALFLIPALLYFIGPKPEDESDKEMKMSPIYNGRVGPYDNDSKKPREEQLRGELPIQQHLREQYLREQHPREQYPREKHLREQYPSEQHPREQHLREQYLTDPEVDYDQADPATATVPPHPLKIPRAHLSLRSSH